MDKHLITVDEFKELGRPTSKHLDDDEVTSFISECEDMNIMPAIGLDMYEELSGGGELSEEAKILLNGGKWKETTNEESQSRMCGGLKKALAYFVYAKMSMSDGVILTRSGSMQHDDSYAQRSEDKNSVRRYNEVMNIAEEYLDGCLQYLKQWKGEKIKPVRGTRVHIHAIGD